MATTETKKATVTKPAERELRIERIFAAPRERVWQALTDPKKLARWWGRGNELTIERFELARGGRWRFVEHAEGQSFGFEGEFREISPPHTLAQTFGWDGMPGHVVINTMTLEDLGDGRTKLVTVSLFASMAERDKMIELGMEGGLDLSYAALDKVLAAH